MSDLINGATTCLRRAKYAIGLAAIALAGATNPVILASSQQPSPASDIVQFTLAPPHGATSTVRMTKTVTRSFDGAVEKDPPVEASFVFVHRTTADALEIQIKPALRPTDLARMESIGDIANALLAQGDLTVLHDRKGNYLGIRGLERATSAVLKNIPAQLRPAFEQMIRASVSQFEDRWRGRYAMFLGRNFEVGSFYSGPFTLPLPGGRTATATAEMGVSKRGVIDGVNCVQLVAGYQSTDQSFGELLRAMTSGAVQSMLQGVAKLGQISETERQSISREIKTEMPSFIVDTVVVFNNRALDPRTMMTYAEEDVIRFVGKAKDARGAMQKVQVEHLTKYTYQYQK